MNIKELKPIDNRKSFYGKAQAITNGDEITLYSYETAILKIKGGKLFRIWEGWSATTQRHINAFLQEYADGQSGKAFFTSLPFERTQRPRPYLERPAAQLERRRRQ